MVFSRRRRLWGWRGAGEALRGSEPVVASIGLTEGKEGGSSGPRTKAWSRAEDGGNDDVIFAALNHRRPGYGRLCRLPILLLGLMSEDKGWRCSLFNPQARWSASVPASMPHHLIVEPSSFGAPSPDPIRHKTPGRITRHAAPRAATAPKAPPLTPPPRKQTPQSCSLPLSSPLVLSVGRLVPLGFPTGRRIVKIDNIIVAS